MSPLERLLERALLAGDRVGAIRLAQRLWNPGDLRRTAVVGMFLEPGTLDSVSGRVYIPGVERINTGGHHA